LKSMAETGLIGSVAPRHFSFMGSIAAPGRLIANTAPQVARILLEDEVDAVLLTPVWPMCHQSVGLIQSIIEKTGIPTASVTLLREITERVAPPRALFVDFPLGYPLGVPQDGALQSRIVLAVLTLLSESVPPAVLWHLLAGGWYLLSRQTADQPILQTRIGLVLIAHLPGGRELVCACRCACSSTPNASGKAFASYDRPSALLGQFQNEKIRMVAQMLARNWTAWPIWRPTEASLPKGGYPSGSGYRIGGAVPYGVAVGTSGIAQWYI
jgi:hypothetical protein